MQLFGLTMSNENITASEIKKAHQNNLTNTLSYRLINILFNLIKFLV
jgi:hypothetical protein